MNTLRPDTLLQNRYKIVSLLGRGGMGAVYRAIDLRFNSTVALKQTLMCGDELARAFEREARLLNKLRHAALPVVSDFFREDEGQFLVMQFIPGDDLATLLERSGHPFESEIVLEWADQLLRALGYLHAHEPPVIHRDIKPQNLKLTPRGEIILLDFGLSKTAVGGGQTQTASRAATSLSVVGYTPHYAPFEQITGGGTDARSDLFSLAATVYHLLTNTAPIDALRRAESTMNGAGDPLRPVHELNPSVPVAVSEVFHKALAMNREMRPASAAEFRRLLGEARGKTDVGSGALTVTPAALNAPTVTTAPPSFAATSGAHNSFSTNPFSTVSDRRSFWMPLIGGTGALALVLCGIFVWNSTWRTRAPNAANSTSPMIEKPADAFRPNPIPPSEASFKFDTLTLAPNGAVKEKRTMQARFFSEDLGGGVSLDMVSIPAGKYLMGTEDGESEYPDEAPQHEVSVPQFYMGKFEVTQAQWRAVARLPKVKIDLNPDPSEFKGDTLPVENVSWFEAMEFCARLSIKTGRLYRLPSEAEWEYAARAGKQTHFAFGEAITSDIANFDGTAPFGSSPKSEYRQRTIPVGNLGIANAFGLYDMHGNVWEWCAGEYHNSYRDAPTDGSAWFRGDERQRVRRGGAWDSLAVDCRSANRYSYAPEGKRNTLGFRVAMSLPKK
jgi:formylglycine-generating enzyme required for sulfatase activity